MILTDQEKSSNYYQNAAMHKKPDYVPSVVRIVIAVHGDGPCYNTQVNPGLHECKSNINGAVSVVATNGKMLGLKLDEFTPVSWRDNYLDGVQTGSLPEREFSATAGA